jgi:1,2-phenylacetyl-CoA epoxidase catalytic subunit
MKRLPAVAALLCAVCLSSGCHLFHKKKADQTPKDNPNIAIQVEAEFRQRWVDKRTGELTDQGMNADQARAQALAEFRQKYSATSAAQAP